MKEISTSVSFHTGRALLHLAGIYGTPIEMIQELVQNGIDTDVQAKQIEILISLKTGRIIVRDNGLGTSIQKFEEALATVATPGRKGKSAIGQYGLGLMGPIDKCEECTFTSRDKTVKDSPFSQWTFNAEKIAACADELTIPRITRDDITSGNTARRGQTSVWWTTEIHLKNINCATALSKMDAEGVLAHIQSRFGVVLHRNNVLLSVSFTDADGNKKVLERVKTDRFRGEKLEPVSYQMDEVGWVNINLFRHFSTKGTKGIIQFGIAGKDDRLPAEQVFKDAQEYLPSEVLAALQSGHIEGEIISQNLTLKPNRRRFYDNEPFVGLCLALEKWYQEYGKAVIAEFKDEARASRLQQMGLRSMTVIEGLLALPENAHLKILVEGFGHGHIGSGHADVSKRKETGEIVKALATTGNPGEKKGEPVNGKHKPHQEKGREENPNHTPFAVTGPHGRNRKIVRSSSSGLMFAYEMMEGSGELWKLDMQKGEITFNIRHPAWVACEKNESHTMKLQEVIALNALLLETMPDQQRSFQRNFVEHQIGVLVGWITSGDKTRREIHPELV